MKDYYAILNVARTAGQDEIRAAYRKLARQCHPDTKRPEERAQAEEKFKELAEAYEILGNIEKRAKYDVSLRSVFGELALDSMADILGAVLLGGKKVNKCKQCHGVGMIPMGFARQQCNKCGGSGIAR